MKNDEFLNKKIKNIQIVAFEGPDCCGKSTQVNNLIETKLRHEFDVVLKFHFPFNIFDDDSLKGNYENLVNSIYSKEYIESDKFNVDDLYQILSRNVYLNSMDKQIFLCTLSNMLYQYDCPDFRFTMKIDGIKGLSINELLSNDNCEIWFNGEKINKNYNEEIKMVTEFFKTTYDPNTCIVFDRFIMSGIFYNYFLPRKIMDKYIEQNIFDEQTISKINDIFKLLKQAQKNKTKFEMVLLNRIFVDTPLFNIISDENCYPTITWFVFKQSDEIYKIFLKDKSRKKEAYDIDNSLRDTINEIYSDIATDGNNSKYLFNIKFNIESVDTDEFIKTYGLKLSLNKITNSIYTSLKMNRNNYNELIEKIHNFYYDSYIKI